jgi:hypothetical protein
MSIGNLKDYGNKGNNFPWQLKVLAGLQSTFDEIGKVILALANIEGYTSLLPGILANTNANARTPVFLKDTGTFTVIPQCYSLSITSTGTAAALVNGAPLTTGQSISFDAGSLNNYFNNGSFNVDTVTNFGAEVIITYVF